MLPQCLNTLKEIIAENLNKAECVVLIPDIWQHNFTTFLGLCAILTLSTCETQLIVLGRRIDGESAEDKIWHRKYSE